MTCTRVGLGLGLSFVGLSWLLAGCNNDPQRVELVLLAPSPDQVMTMADDADDTRSGLQLAVQGQAHSIRQGTTVNLFIDEDQRPETAMVDAEGMIDFGQVTLPPGEHGIFIETSTGSASSDKAQKYTFKALLIKKPLDGARLSSKDDEDAYKDQVQITPEV